MQGRLGCGLRRGEGRDRDFRPGGIAGLGRVGLEHGAVHGEVQLAEVVPCRLLSEESRAAFTDGNRFETVLPDAGKRVWLRLLTGAVEPRERRRFIEDFMPGKERAARRRDRRPRWLAGRHLPGVLAAARRPTCDRDWFLERIGQPRSREAKEIEKAGKRR